MAILIEAAGWIAAVLILASYILVSSNKLSAQSRPYQWLNVAGSALFVANTLWHGALPSAALNAVWCAVGVFTLWRIARPAAS